MALFEMTVYPRTETGKNANRRTRAAGRTPAVVYGNQREQALTVELDTAELRRAFLHQGRRALLALTMEGTGETFVAKLQEIQVHPVTDEILHVDLLDIPMGVPLEVEVPLEITGDNRAVRGGDANLEVVRRTVTVECLPREVPASIPVDYSDLQVGDKIVVGQLETPAGKIVTDPEEMVLKLASTALLVDAETPAEAGEAGEEAEGGESPDGEGDAGD